MNQRPDKCLQWVSWIEMGTLPWSAKKNQGDGNNNVNGECHKCDSLQVKNEGSDDNADEDTQIEGHKNDEK